MKLNTHEIGLEMARKAMTRKEIAEKAGISRQFLNTMLTRGSCTPINAGKIAVALGVDVSVITKEG